MIQNLSNLEFKVFLAFCAVLYFTAIFLFVTFLKWVRSTENAFWIICRFPINLIFLKNPLKGISEKVGAGTIVVRSMVFMSFVGICWGLYENKEGVSNLLAEMQ